MTIQSDTMYTIIATPNPLVEYQLNLQHDTTPSTPSQSLSSAKAGPRESG